MIALSAHKLHGPKGVGALWIAEGAAPTPLLHGGGQEAAGRSGTLSPALCAGFGVAAELMTERQAADAAHVARLWDVAIAGLSEDWIVNGSVEQRYRGNLNVRRAGLDVARLMSDLRDVAISAGSACASGSGRPSHVLAALGLNDAEARSSIRIGFGRYTTEDELTEAVARIDAAARAQRVAGVTLVRFIGRDGAVSAVTAVPGARLLDVAQADNQPLEGTCGGDMACATCHVIVAAADFALLPPASPEEEDMLDLVAGCVRTSRLACQIFIAPEWPELTVSIPFWR